MSKKPLDSLSIFFPVYNEEENIALVIIDAVKNAGKIADKFEIICVNDGSQDQTKAIVKKLAAIYPSVRLFTHKKNQGYGATIRTGLEHCRYNWIFFTDSDGQFHFDELATFIKHRDEADFVVGYRAKRQDHLVRIILAQGLLKCWNRLMFDLKLRDIDCAYKLIPKKCLTGIKLTTSSAITVTELVYRLTKKGCHYIEVPVTHYPRLHGMQTGSNPRVILRALRESIRLWWEITCTSAV